MHKSYHKKFHKKMENVVQWKKWFVREEYKKVINLASGNLYNSLDWNLQENTNIFSSYQFFCQKTLRSMYKTRRHMACGQVRLVSSGVGNCAGFSPGVSGLIICQPSPTSSHKQNLPFLMMVLGGFQILSVGLFLTWECLSFFTRNLLVSADKPILLCLS